MADTLTPKQRSALSRAVRHPELQFVLFNKADGLSWYDGFRDAGFLAPESIPKPMIVGDGTIQIPAWPVAEYLVRNSKYLVLAENNKYAYEVWELICKATHYAKENSFGNYRVWWQFSKIIRNLPLEIIKDGYLEVLSYWLSDRFDRGLVGDQLVTWCQVLMQTRNDLSLKIAFSLLQLIFRVEAVDNKYLDDDQKEAILTYQSHQKRKQLIPLASKAGRIFGKSAVSFFADKLGEVLAIEQADKWSTIWRPAIEDHEQNHASEEANHIVLECLRDSLVSRLSISECIETTEEIWSLLESPLNTIRRVAIYAAKLYHQKLSDEVINTIIDKDYFCETYRHELWHFLNSTYTYLNENKRKNVIEIITKDVVYLDDSGNRDDRRTAFYQSLWLSSIKDSDEVALSRYVECVEITGVVPDHPDFPNYSTGGPVVHQSPAEIDDLFTMSSNLQKMVDFLNEYTFQGFFNEPGLEGLVETFGGFVSAHPEFVLKNLDSFLPLKPYYLNELFDSFLNAWNAESKIDWRSAWPVILKFAQRLFSEKSFWQHPEEPPGGAFIGNTHWVVGTFSRFVESGCKNDKHSFAIDNAPLVKRVLEVILEKQPGEDFADDSDAVSIAINSPRGKSLEAYIHLSLFHLRNSPEVERAKISETYLATFESELNKADEQNPEFEFATLIANFYPNFLYISKEWTTKNLSKIFDYQNHRRWLCAVQGYSYVGQFIKEIYVYFKESGYFFAILDSQILRDRIRERYIEMLVIAYYRRLESISDRSSLISQFIERNIDRELGQLIWFIWSLRNESTQERAREMVFELFPRILEVIDLESKEGRFLASRLCLWAEFFDRLDEESKRWLLTIAPYANDDYNTDHLLDGLALLSEQQPFDAADIWLEMLYKYAYDSSSDEIKVIFRNLVAHGHQGVIIAKAIADRYLHFRLTKPSEWLTEIIYETRSI